MNRVKKKQLIIFGLILLTLINLSAVTTYWLKKPEPHRRIRPSTQNANEYLAEKLGLNDAQRSAFLKEQKDYYNSIRVIQDSIRTVRRRMFTELAELEPDTLLIKQLSGSIGSHQTSFEQHTAEHLLRLSAMCTSEQKTKLSKVIRQSSFRRMSGRKAPLSK
jgi:hypothetical protein